MTRDVLIEMVAGRAEDIRSRFGVIELGIFGSVARDEANDASDIDVLVTFEGPAGFDQFMELRFYLEDLLGSPVDLVTRKALRNRLLPVVEKEMIRVA